MEKAAQGGKDRSGKAIMDGLRNYIMVDSHEAVKIGELDKNVESRKVVQPKFTTDCPEAVVREGADELTSDQMKKVHCALSFHRHHECGRQKMVATARG